MQRGPPPAVGETEPAPAASVPHGAVPPCQTDPRSPGLQQGDAGTSSGVNIAPGSDDDGWIVPDPVRLSDGTYVQLYKDGEALHAAYNAISRARFRVCLESYIFASDDTGRAFADLLAKKAREGVRVYLIYDAFGSIMSDRRMFKTMRRAGVQVRVFHPIRPWDTRFGWRPINRDHRKLLVIDDHLAGLGGLNVGGEYAGSWVIPNGSRECELWRDNAIGLRGPSAMLFLKAFGRIWNYIERGGRFQRAELVYNLDGSCGDLGVLASVPTARSPLRRVLFGLMSSAQQSLYMTMAYFAPDDGLVEVLCGAAQRGVRVRLMLPGRSDVKVLQIAARSYYEKLMACGIEVYERQAVVLHSKTMVIDSRTTVIGSTNLDYRSIEYNCEISAIIRSERFGRQMHDLFANDVRYARKMELSEWRRRPVWDRFVQWAVSRARYVL